MPQNIRIIIARKDGGQVRLPNFTTTTNGEHVILELTAPDVFVLQAEISCSPDTRPSTDGDGDGRKKARRRNS